MEVCTTCSQGNEERVPTCVWRGTQAGSNSPKNELQFTKWMWGRGRKKGIIIRKKARAFTVSKVRRCHQAPARFRGQWFSVAGAWWWKGKPEGGDCKVGRRQITEDLACCAKEFGLDAASLRKL